MPNLTFMWLMTDHTTGTKVPDPVAQVADNDLAVGRVVDTISHSRFWKSTAIFVVEDDTQNGVDHVDGHRGPALVISPYSRAGVDDQYYTQLNMVKTIEQILGIPPMNQEDEAAEPMYDAFKEATELRAVRASAEPDSAKPGVAGRPADPQVTAGGPAAAVSRLERNAIGSRRAIGTRAAMRHGLRRLGWRGRRLAGRRAPASMLCTRRPREVGVNRFWTGTRRTTGGRLPGRSEDLPRPDQVPGRKLPAAFLGDN